ncbi:MAG TPA: phosphatase PAP2 family protein [Mycobacteriales bacterium]
MSRTQPRGRPARPGRAAGRAAVRRPTAAAVAAVAGLALVFLSSVVAADGTVPAWERSVFRALNGLPGWLERSMWAAQLLGVLATPLVPALVAAVLRLWRLALTLVLVLPLKLYVERDVLKEIVQRQRPGQNEPGAILRDVPPAGLSFPSGHALVAFAVATLLAPYLSRSWRLVAFGLALLVCVARVYLGAHNPLDVTAGAGAGLAVGGALILVLGVRRRA